VCGISGAIFSENVAIDIKAASNESVVWKCLFSGVNSGQPTTHIDGFEVIELFLPDRVFAWSNFPTKNNLGLSI
jgi:hypothetical protein